MKHHPDAHLDEESAAFPEIKMSSFSGKALYVLEFVDKWLNRVMMVIGGIAIMALMLTATGNVIARIFKVSFIGAYEMVGWFGAIVIAFALGATQSRKDHIMVDVLTRKFPSWLIKIMDGFKYLSLMIFFGIAARQVFLWGRNIAENNEVSETLKISFYPFVYMVALGFAVLSLTLLIDFLTMFFKERKPEST